MGAATNQFQPKTSDGGHSNEKSLVAPIVVTCVHEGHNYAERPHSAHRCLLRL
jgi:hypothetical protein